MHPSVDYVLQDLRHAARRLRRSPGFVVVATLSIAISLAFNTVIFGLVDVLLLRTLPVRDPGSLVQFFEIRPGIPAMEYFPADFREMVATESTTLVDVMTEVEITTTLEQDAATARVDVGVVSTNYFDALGVEAALGRTPGIADTQADRIAVLSHRAWVRHFAEDPSTVGRAVRLGGNPFLIVGVLPEGFNGTSLDSGPDFRVLAASRPDFGQGPNFLDADVAKLLGRIRPGQSLAAARDETGALWSRFREAFLAGGGVVGPFDRELSVELRPIARGTSRVREQFQGTLSLLFVGAGLVLAMVCLNIGGLLLARIGHARHDTALRRALGASQARIARQWIFESVTLAVLGGIVGLALAVAVMPAFMQWLSPLVGFAGFGRPPTLDLTLDARVVGFGLAAIVLTGVLAAAVPTLWWARQDAYVTLKATTDGRENRRVQSSLSFIQVALSTVLLLGGGLLIRSLDSLNAVDAGFDRESLARFALDSRLAGYDGPATAAFAGRLLEETATLPGVEAVALTVTPVMQGIGVVMVVATPDEPAAPGSWNTNVNQVTAGYFDAMGLEVLDGALFDDEPLVADGPAPVVVNEAFARRFFPGASAVGREFDSALQFATPTYRIVGVVSNANYRSLRELDPPIFYGNALGQVGRASGAFSLLVRASAPESVIEPVRAIVRSIDPALPVLEAVTMADEVQRSLWRERLATVVTGAFAAIGLAVAAIGLYAVLAQYVASRRREIGIRIALGARALEVLRLVGGRVASVVLLGIVAGTLAHLAFARWLESLLYEVAPLDPPVVAASAAALLLASGLAGLVPVRRAVAVDPARTLRED